VVAVEPDHEMHGLEGLKHLSSAIVPEIYDAGAHDEKVTASTEDAYAMCAEVLRDQGLLVGPSAGAALWAAREIGRGLSSAVIVALLADGGERYLSGDRAS
jgi:cysteine synthase B